MRKHHPTYFGPKQSKRYQDIAFLRKALSYFDSQFKNTAHHDLEDMAAGVRDNWLCCIHMK